MAGLPFRVSDSSSVNTVAAAKAAARDFPEYCFISFSYAGRLLIGTVVLVTKSRPWQQDALYSSLGVVPEHVQPR
jgi:hypothetical protein